MIEIHWGWLPVVFLAGAFFGCIVAAAAWCLCVVAGMSDEAEKTIIAKE